LRIAQRGKLMDRVLSAGKRAASVDTSEEAWTDTTEGEKLRLRTFGIIGRGCHRDRSPQKNPHPKSERRRGPT